MVADFHVNFLSPLAHGNAIEEGWGESIFVPTIYCVPATMRLSRLTKGMVNVDTVITYENVDAAYVEIERIFTEMTDWQAKAGVELVPGVPGIRPRNIREFFIQRKLERRKIFHPVLTAIHEILATKNYSEFSTLDRIWKHLRDNGVRLDEEKLAKVISGLLHDKLIDVEGCVWEGDVLVPYFSGIAGFGCAACGHTPFQQNLTPVASS